MAVDWTFSDYQTVAVHVEPSNQAYEVSLTQSDSSSILGLNVTSTSTDDVPANPYPHGDEYPPFHVAVWTNDLVASGDASDLMPFIGTGGAVIPITPSYDVSATPFGVVYAGGELVEDSATLSVTYVTASTPEPRWAWVLVVGLMVAASLSRRFRTSATNPVRSPSSLNISTSHPISSAREIRTCYRSF